MFTYLGGGCVRTGKSGHAYILNAKSGESYIYNRELATGAQSYVQLVTNVSTHEVVVRKVSRDSDRRDLKDESDLATVPKDNELRILDRLNSIRRNPVYPQPGLTPRWTTCISHENLAIMSSGPRPRLQCARVSYWKLCNGGDLADLRLRWVRGSFGEETEGHLFPVCLVARCIAQVCETLHFMYQAGPEAVYHIDVHLSNIFLHYDSSSNGGLPDFYLGDFGLAVTAREDLAGRAKHAPVHPWRSSEFDERERWDVAAFRSAIEYVAQLTRIPLTSAPAPCSPKAPSEQSMQLQEYIDQLTRVPLTSALDPCSLKAPSEQSVQLQRLMYMLQFMDNQDEQLAARNPQSRPPSLLEVIHEARKLEASALEIERDTVPFKALMAWGRSLEARALREEPYVFEGKKTRKRAYASVSEAKAAPLQTQRTRVAQAEKHGEDILEGPWTLVESE
jgi:serine/threonine protein kinase